MNSREDGQDKEDSRANDRHSVEWVNTPVAVLIKTTEKNNSEIRMVASEDPTNRALRQAAQQMADASPFEYRPAEIERDHLPGTRVLKAVKRPIRFTERVEDDKSRQNGNNS